MGVGRPGCAGRGLGAGGARSDAARRASADAWCAAPGPSRAFADAGWSSRHLSRCRRLDILALGRHLGSQHTGGQQRAARGGLQACSHGAHAAQHPAWDALWPVTGPCAAAGARHCASRCWQAPPGRPAPPREGRDAGGACQQRECLNPCASAVRQCGARGLQGRALAARRRRRRCCLARMGCQRAASLQPRTPCPCIASRVASVPP